MKNRAEALSLLAELRGRLDELEQLICFAPDFAVLSPALYDEPGVETLTPAGYLAFRKQDLAAPQGLNPQSLNPQGPNPQALTPQTLKPYEAFGNFIQFGAPGTDISASVESFELSNLHRAEAERALGLRLVPQGEKQKWFTYEFLTEVANLAEWDWMEWVLKLSVDEPFRLHPQFILDFEGKLERVSLGECPATKFATFVHFRLDPKKLDRPPQSPARIRLVFGTSGGRALPLTLYQFAIYGKRLTVKGENPGS